ncbi:SGNH/GDSL hydrolase family protein [Phytoactinopolyspora halotolerans]|uniref:SGNH/GDSL hydrolase family protein n=1 Tax=Phytoactinopolyspora halotolerans TaxID=1981512 RepID=A0A6L9S5L5_9ACTN|nr:SGNH/GDSL hydrolase family protein [Phytoactinopolyspora halotolerans]NED99787.1 SGNH/GDSL hydrolase family protein [Phytoactinopolyspora halotolerans]
MAGLINAHNARRIARAAAYGGGGVSLLSASFYGLLRLQARVARRTITGVPLSGPPQPDAVYGMYQGQPISFVVLGDSCAAGYGAPTPEETPGALLASGLAEIAERPVQLTTVAKVGARSADLSDQVDKALVADPQVALIIVGGNDVTNKVPPAEAVRSLIQAVRRLHDNGCEVVVGTCPDLGTIKPIQPPLRWLARRSSRNLAAAQTVAVVEAGGRTVSLGSILGPEFAASPAELFSDDQFHPSSAGYAHAAAAMLPSLAAALGLWSEEEEALEPVRGDSVLPVSVAAAAAADEAGTEVAATTVDGRGSGPRGPWALLRNRGRAGAGDDAPSAGPAGDEPTDVVVR